MSRFGISRPTRRVAPGYIALALGLSLICSCGDSTDPKDTTAPDLIITAPTESAVIVGDTLITASATDDVGVTSVTFYYDDTELGTDTAAPYEQPLTFDGLPEGYDGEPEAHLIRATAVDAAGNISLPDSVTISLLLSILDTTAPDLIITAPTESAVIVGNTLITASATDNVGVTSVTFYYDDTELGTDTAAPYEQSLTFDGLPEGYDGEPEAHLIRATAVDAAGNISLPDSVTISLLLPIPDSTAPAVTLTAPVADADISGRVVFSAEASDGDDGTGITVVIFYLDDTEIGRTPIAPYSIEIPVLAYADGESHIVKAAAVDGAENTGESATIAVTISQGMQIYLADLLELATAGSHNGFDFDRLVDLDSQIEYLLDEELIITVDTCIRGNGAEINCRHAGNIQVLLGAGFHHTRFDIEFCVFGYGNAIDDEFRGVIEYQSATNGWITNNTFYENEPAALYIQESSFDYDIRILNNIFYSNEVGIVRTDTEGQDDVVVIKYNCSAGNRSFNFGIYCGCPDIPYPEQMPNDEIHNSNIQDYPEFVHVWAPKQPYWDLRLLPNSPCKDAGEGGVNMGALPVAQ